MLLDNLMKEKGQKTVHYFSTPQKPMGELASPFGAEQGFNHGYTQIKKG